MSLFYYNNSYFNICSVKIVMVSWSQFTSVSIAINVVSLMLEVYSIQLDVLTCFMILRKITGVQFYRKETSSVIQSWSLRLFFTHHDESMAIESWSAVKYWRWQKRERHDITNILFQLALHIYNSQSMFYAKGQL